jgi:hypothetical protein
MSVKEIGYASVRGAGEKQAGDPRGDGTSQGDQPACLRSVARGEDGPDSDLDILVDGLPGMSLFDLGGLQAEMEDLLPCRVDVVTAGGLKARMRDRILAEAIAICPPKSGCSTISSIWRKQPPKPSGSSAGSVSKRSRTIFCANVRLPRTLS